MTWFEHLHPQEGVEVRVARIFNTFGSRMHMNDGRVVSNFILQALQGEPLTVRILSVRLIICFQCVDQVLETNLWTHWPLCLQLQCSEDAVIAVDICENIWKNLGTLVWLNMQLQEEILIIIRVEKESLTHGLFPAHRPLYLSNIPVSLSLSLWLKGKNCPK